MGGRDQKTKRWAEQSDLTGESTFVQVADDKSIQGDSTTNRVLRQIEFIVTDGTNASTLKCTVVSLWNGDTIAETDNVAKGATTGNFTLSADGSTLTIEAAGLSGSVVMAHGNKVYNAGGPILDVDVKAGTNDIQIVFRNPTTGTGQDVTAHVDKGLMILYILYLTVA